MGIENSFKAREYARHVIRDLLGTSRSVASQMKADGIIDDEEKAFQMILQDISHVIKIEMSKLEGAETASKMLDPFSRIEIGADNDWERK